MITQEVRVYNLQTSPFSLDAGSIILDVQFLFIYSFLVFQFMQWALWFAQRLPIPQT